MTNTTTLLTTSVSVTDSLTLRTETSTVTERLTTLSSTTTSDNYTTSDRESTIPSIVTVTRTAFATTSNTSEVTYTKGDGKSSMGAIVGGCVGGALAVIVLVIVILVVRRMRSNRRHSSVPTLPGKDFLETLHTDRAVTHLREVPPTELEEKTELDKHYANLKENGETDEQTDPSVGPDGYLKKTKNFFGKHMHKKNKKGKNAKMNAKRSDSMPINHAPPPPRENSQYAEGRIPESSFKHGKTSDTSPYANVCSQQKDKPEKSNKSKGKSTERKGKEQTDTVETDTPLKSNIKGPEKQKVYENVDSAGAHYYNLNQNRQDNTRLSAYEDVETKTNRPLQQDDVYENP